LPGKRISRVELGGKPGELYDRVFVAGLSEIKGFSKKGKQFFNFDSNTTEPIKSM
jgi:Bardet-Biedl syndrome 7 protein